MSMTQTAFGVGIVVAALSGVLNVVLPAPPPITINSLAFDGVNVQQDRTVRANSDAGIFWAQWAADVVNAETGTPVPHCQGSGSWNYKSGQRVVTMDLAQWTGNAACLRDALLPGVYRLQATWHWGGEQTSAVSQPFEVK